MKNKIKNEIKKLSDTKYKEFHSKLCPNTNNILGVRVPILRKYAKELMKENDYKTILKEIDNEYYEEIMLQGMIIGLAKDDFKIILEYIEKFISKIDNWAVCDTFIAGLKIVNKNKEEYWDFINQYKNGKEFERRFLVVSMLDFYIEEKYLKEDFKIIDTIEKEEYYVKMAVAWFISIAYIKFPSKTEKYLKKNNLDQFTQNKAIQKIRESYRVSKEEKNKLLSLKR